MNWLWLIIDYQSVAYYAHPLTYLNAMTESKEDYPDVLQYVEIKPQNKHSATVIFLHVPTTTHISYWDMLWFVFLGTGR